MYKSQSPMIRAILLVLLLALIPRVAAAVPFEGQEMLIAGPSPYAIQIGQEIANKGGNVVDVAVTVALALSVTSPYYAAFGGGGFALIRQSAQKPVGQATPSIDVLDFRETAPGATSPSFYTGTQARSSQDGGSAVGVPGVPAGLWALHQKYGKLPWRQLFTKVLALANDGFQVSGEWYQLTQANASRFNPAGKRVFLLQQKGPPKPGEVLQQPQLAKFLKLYRRLGAQAFYQGPVAQDIAKTVQDSGGVLSEKDLRLYQVRWLTPLQVEFAQHTVYLMPPPSSGGIVIASALKLIEMTKLQQQTPLSIEELHTLAEIMKRSFRGRSLLGDPDFHKNPLEYLTSLEYLRPLAQSIRKDHTTKILPLAEVPQTQEHGNTTHLSVLDRHGNGVAMTITLNGSYGSGVVSEKYGIALNNEMDDFTTRPGAANLYGLIQGAGNQVEPGKRPLSSMSPTLVANPSGQIVMSLGAPGGPRIINGVLQVLYRTLVNDWDMDRAIQAPRIHHQFSPDTLYFDEFLLQPATQQGLIQRGHQLKPSWIAKVYGIRRNKAGWLEAAFDSRGEGAVGGF